MDELEIHNVDELIESFINYLIVECGLSRNTILSYSHDLQLFTNFLLSKKISDFNDVRPGTITSFIISEKKRGLSITSVTRTIVSTRMLYRFLLSEGGCMSPGPNVLDFEIIPTEYRWRFWIQGVDNLLSV